MSDTPIPFGKPMLDAAEIEAVTRVLSGPQLVHGPVSKAFEEAFAARIGAKRAVSVSSCTAGLHLSLFAHGIGAGDEVVVPAMTHVATAHAVEFCGARPVFVDVEPDTGNLDAAALEQAVGAEDQGDHAGALSRPALRHGPHQRRRQARRRRRGRRLRAGGRRHL